MGFKFNPLTGLLEIVGESISESVISKKEIIRSVLLESRQDSEFPVAMILFDIDSILYNDDEEL